MDTQLTDYFAITKYLLVWLIYEFYFIFFHMDVKIHEKQISKQFG